MIQFPNPETRNEARDNAIEFAREMNRYTPQDPRFNENAAQASVWARIAATFPEDPPTAAPYGWNAPAKGFGPERNGFTGAGYSDAPYDPDDSAMGPDPRDVPTEAIELPAQALPVSDPAGHAMVVSSAVWDLLRAVALRAVLADEQHRVTITGDEMRSTRWNLQVIELPGSDQAVVYAESVG